MNTERVPFIAGNWKMNLDHQQAIALVQKLAWTLNDANHDFSKTEVAVFPPFTDLRTVQTLIDAEKFQIRLGAQDLSQHESGAYTGEISGAFLKKLDVKYVIVGHSERRMYHHEDDELIQAKVAAAFKQDLVPVICVGETLEQLEQFGQSAIPVQQLKKAISGHKQVGEFIVAYEPVWAIGVAAPADSGYINAVCSKIKEFATQIGSTNLQILYGGSANQGLFEKIAQSVDGLFLGRSAHDVQNLKKIVQEVESVALELAK